MRTVKLLLLLALVVAANASAQVPCSKIDGNNPPLVNDDYYAWPPPATLDVLANDADVELEPLTIVSVSQVTGGTATISADRRTIAFTPAAGATSGSLVYAVSDGVNSPPPTATVRMQTGGRQVDFTSTCSGSKCTFTVNQAYTAGARWFSWDFGDQTTKPNWTGFNIFKEYAHVAPGQTQTYNVTLAIDFMDGSRGVLTKPVQLVGLEYNVQYRIFEGASTVIVNDIVPMSIRVEFLSSTFPTPASEPSKRYRYYLQSPLAVPSPNEFGAASNLTGAPVGAMVTMQFAQSGITDLSIFVREERLSQNNIWVETGQTWTRGNRNLQVVDKPPTVIIGTPVTNANGSVTFDPWRSWDDRGINSTQYEFSWDFGDGKYAPGVIRSDGSLQAITHTYERPGTFQAYLRLIDRVMNHTATDSAAVTIANRPPQAAFTFECAGLTCTFDGAGSTDEEELARHDWGFGDGAGGVGETTTRTFAAPGCYQVDLIVTDNAGAQAAKRRTISVSNQQLAAATMAAVDVHAQGGITQSNLNGILEPGEVVFVEPSRTSPMTAPMSGQAMGWSGGGLSGTYTTVDGNASYGLTEAGAKTNCWATGNCYALGVTAPNGRPQLHWDGTFAEHNDVLGYREFKVHIGNSFSDVPQSSPFYTDVEALLHWGVTGGCGGNQFCTGPATRRDFVTLLMRARSAKSGAQPPQCTVPPFADVPCSDPGARYILEAKTLGITNGCGGGTNFCPDAQLTRAEVAVFLVRALGVTPPPCDQTFADVQCVATATTPKHWAADFISEIYRRGITSGCTASPLNFCPNDVVRRDQAATFLVRSFGLEVAFPQCPRGTVVVAGEEGEVE